jgi:hypothetical protein
MSTRPNVIIDPELIRWTFALDHVNRTIMWRHSQEDAVIRDVWHDQPIVVMCWLTWPAVDIEHVLRTGQWHPRAADRDPDRQHIRRADWEEQLRCMARNTAQSLQTDKVYA